MTYISNKNFALEVAKGNVASHASFEEYGKNIDIDAVSAPGDIWDGGDEYTGFPTGAAETLEIFSSSALDTSAGTGARTATIYNLLDDTGAAVADVTVTLNGTTAVSLGAGLYYRGGTRIKVITAGSTGANQGTITLRHTTTTTNIFAVMPELANQTAIAAYTVPLGKTLYITGIKLEMSRLSGAAGSAITSFRGRPNGGVFNTVVSPTITDSNGYITPSDSIFKFTERTDIKGRVESVSDNDTTVTCVFTGYLVDN